MGGWPRYEVPEGWVARSWRFEVETTTSAQRPLIAQHFGARRFAYNWALAQVKANLDVRAADPSVPPLAWTLPTLRKAWNQAKAEVAPWWPSCSKEAYGCGIADLVAGLHAWSASKQGQRAGSRSGSPSLRPATATAAESGSPLARCGWSPIVVISPCRLSAAYGQRRASAALSGR
jgi:putative transposase